MASGILCWMPSAAGSRKATTTHRYQFYSDRVKIYQDDTVTWGAFYLECPTGVYESAMAGVG